MFHKQLLGGLFIVCLLCVGGTSKAQDSTDPQGGSSATLSAEEKKRWTEYQKLNDEERRAYREQARQDYDRKTKEMRRKGQTGASKEDSERFAKLRGMSKKERAAFYEQNRKKYEADIKTAREERIAKMSKEERKTRSDKWKNKRNAKAKQRK